MGERTPRDIVPARQATASGCNHCRPPWVLSLDDNLANTWPLLSQGGGCALAQERINEGNTDKVVSCRKTISIAGRAPNRTRMQSNATHFCNPIGDNLCPRSHSQLSARIQRRVWTWRLRARPWSRLRGPIWPTLCRTDTADAAKSDSGPARVALAGTNDQRATVAACVPRYDRYRAMRPAVRTARKTTRSPDVAGAGSATTPPVRRECLQQLNAKKRPQSNP
jgi:hypothetical protein